MAETGQNTQPAMVETDQTPQTTKSGDASRTQTLQPNFSNNDISHSFQITQHKLNGFTFREWYQSILLVIKE